eukprot:2128130-Amphidinium_carterae.1
MRLVSSRCVLWMRMCCRMWNCWLVALMLKSLLTSCTIPPVRRTIRELLRNSRGRLTLATLRPMTIWVPSRIAAVLKPNQGFKTRLAHDLRCSGVNLRVKCLEWVVLPRLCDPMHAALDVCKLVGEDEVIRGLGD